MNNNDIETPRVEVENILVELWKEVFGVEEVRVNDNFFELGGNSLDILGIISKLSQKGYRLPLSQFYATPCIECLAIYLSNKNIQNDRPIYNDLFPISPRQLLLRSKEYEDINSKAFQKLNKYYTIKKLFDLNIQVDESTFRQAVEILVNTHYELNIRFKKEDSDYYQYIPDSFDINEIFSYNELESLSIPEFERQLVDLAFALQETLDIFTKPSLRIALIKSNIDSIYRILIIVHNLLADDYSLQILVNDLETIILELSRGNKDVFLPRTDSIRRWAEEIISYTKRDNFIQDFNYWVEVAGQNFATFPSQITIDERAICHISDSLSSDETTEFYQQTSRARLNKFDVLLSLLFVTLDKFMVEGCIAARAMKHGRDVFEDIDLSRTVGYISYSVPLILLRSKKLSLDFKNILLSLKGQFYTMKKQHLSYLASRVCNDDNIISLINNIMSRTLVGFNYFDLDSVVTKSTLLKPSIIKPMLDDEAVAFKKVIYLSANSSRRRLEFTWVFNRQYYSEDYVRSVADYYKSLILKGNWLV